MRPWRRPGATKPDDVLALEEQVGHRAATWGRSGRGAAVLATRTALVIGGDPPTVLPWHCIDRASWESPTFSLTYRDPDSGASQVLQLELAERGDLPRAVRDRVTRSVVLSRRVELSEGAGAVVAARRDDSGAVSWTVVFDPGLDPTDPQLQQQARLALQDLRQSLGA